MLIPTLVHDNFFTNLEEVITYAKQLEYLPNKDGRWPGKRTLPLHEINNDLFISVTNKITKLLWPSVSENISYSAYSMFQSIPKEYVNAGWVHQDVETLTAIIYLSKHTECGTSIFECKNFNTVKNTEKKKDIYLNNDFKNENKYLKENNDNFTETISIKSRQNRIVIFDSKQMHAAHKFIEKDINEDRLTLITFFTDIYGPGVKWHGPECGRN
jgi:hypothetical protein